MSAYVTVGKVLAQRCLESGYNEVYADLSSPYSPKVNVIYILIKNN